jgi:hypothetical protein
LAAQSSVIDLKSQMAGMTAMCTANPYPIITVGDGNATNSKIIKKTIDREAFIEAELNP